MDGRDVRTAFRNGSFDLVGLLSTVEHRCRRMKARRIAIDGLDVLLAMIDDPAVMRREVYRLSDWLGGAPLDRDHHRAEALGHEPRCRLAMRSSPSFPIA